MTVVNVSPHSVMDLFMLLGDTGREYNQSLLQPEALNVSYPRVSNGAKCTALSQNQDFTGVRGLGEGSTAFFLLYSESPHPFPNTNVFFTKPPQLPSTAWQLRIKILKIETLHFILLSSCVSSPLTASASGGGHLGDGSVANVVNPSLFQQLVKPRGVHFRHRT